MRIGGFSFWTRNSAGEVNLVSYHPKRSGTWHWYVGFTRRQRELKRLISLEPKRFRRGQWHDYIRVPFGHIIIGRQDWHRGRAA